MESQHCCAIQPHGSKCVRPMAALSTYLLAANAQAAATDGTSDGAWGGGGGAVGGSGGGGGRRPTHAG